MNTVFILIPSFLVRGQWWQLVALVALFFVAGCTVEFYPPVQEVSDLPDGGKVDVLPDTIPDEFAFGPRMYWSQIVASDSAYSIAVTDVNNKGRWLDSLRWVPSGPFVTVNGDTLSTRSYARDNSGVTGDNQVLTYNGSGSLTIEDGNTVDMSDLLDNTDDQTIDTFSLSGATLNLSIESDGQAAQTVDLSALAVIDSTRLAQDSILVYYQDGAEVGRDTIAGTGGGGGGVADNLGDHTMTQNLQTNGNWISGDGGNEGIYVDASGNVGIGTNSPTQGLEINDKELRFKIKKWSPGTPNLLDTLITYVGNNGAPPDRYGGRIMSYYRSGTNFGFTFGAMPGLTYTGVDQFLNIDVKNGRLGVGVLDPATIFHTKTPARFSYASDETKYFNLSSNANGDFVVDPVGDVRFDDQVKIYVESWGVGTPDLADTLITYVGNNGAPPDRYGGRIKSFYRGPTSFGFSIGAANDMGLTYEGLDDAFTIDVYSGYTGIRQPYPSYVLDINSTNAIRLPVGTTAQRPTGADGLLRLSSTNNRLEAYYNAQWNTIASEGIEDDGSASDTTDGSGDITVSHTLGSASITVTATTTGTTFYNVQVHTKTSTTFKIRFFDATGAAVTATAVTADWIAKLQ